MRMIFIYISIEHTDVNKGSPFIYVAFVCFGIVEMIRYPFYISKILGLEATLVGKILGHLRYNLFIFFYPVGAFADGCVLYWSLETIQTNGFYNYHMPNTMNFGFDYIYFIYMVVFPVYIFGFPINYNVLFAGRAKFYK